VGPALRELEVLDRFRDCGGDDVLCVTTGDFEVLEFEFDELAPDSSSEGEIVTYIPSPGAVPTWQGSKRIWVCETLARKE
jgi:hypothetical protein